ncbi:MAG: hypothetical protein BZY81_07985 [SAR202 cluster bacterium Io17-Chloro-G4]|nr:MAG: hypothetical protein BZY81_07985 [SAR202 cluster bacterium Io17-Chloro-G4]
MDPQVAKALEQDRTIDITTVGRKSGQTRRTEIWFHNLDGQLFITGFPGTRDWYANLVAHPGFTFHLKESAQADLPALAKPVLDNAQRREIMTAIHGKLEWSRDLEEWVADSPLIEVELT